jgi:hypothetical protein
MMFIFDNFNSFLTIITMILLSSRMMEIQTKMSERAIELLAIDPQGPPKFLLDIGIVYFLFDSFLFFYFLLFLLFSDSFISYAILVYFCLYLSFFVLVYFQVIFNLFYLFFVF